jgi:hypothetical protein
MKSSNMLITAIIGLGLLILPSLPVVAIPMTVVYDYSDAPASYSDAIHNIGGCAGIGCTPVLSGPYLGACVDSNVSIPSPNADGDDNDTGTYTAGACAVAGDDEDGVTFTTPLTQGDGSAGVNVVVGNGTCTLNAWIDFDSDGVFGAGEQIFTDQALANGGNNLTFSIPGTAVVGTTFARFRCSTNAGLGPTGSTSDGEVEDYQITIDTSEPDTDGDGAPDSVEGTGDRDEDGIPDNEDYDPTGYFYDESTGEIISGGQIAVTGPGIVTITQDGSNGFYQFSTDGTAGTYTVQVTLPSGYGWSDTCLRQDPPPFDPTGGPTPTVLGNGEDGDTGLLTSNACTPFYLTFDLAAGDPVIFNNNFPIGELFTLTVNVTGGAAVAMQAEGWSGRVSSDPAGINCGGDCTEIYLRDTIVTLTAYPGLKSYFVGWSGDCDANGQVTLDANKTCIATFGYPVGGIVVPVDKLGLLAPWMGLAALASLAALTVAVVRRRRM